MYGNITEHNMPAHIPATYLPNLHTGRFDSSSRSQTHSTCIPIPTYMYYTPVMYICMYIPYSHKQTQTQLVFFFFGTKKASSEGSSAETTVKHNILYLPTVP